MIINSNFETAFYNNETRLPFNERIAEKLGMIKLRP